MAISELDTVALTADHPAYGLKQGDIGAVVEVYAPDGVEVEFITASGHTEALITLHTHEVRPVGRNDILAVRHHDAA